MSTRTLFCAFACAALWSFVPSSADSACPPLKVMASVDLTMRPDGVALVPVVIDGQPEKLVLSTGSPVTSVNYQYAVDRKFERHYMRRMRFVNQAGQIGGQLVTLPTLGFGNLTAENVQVLVTPGSENRAAPPPGAPVGYLGGDFLRPYDVDLDFAHGKMNLISRDHCEDRFLYWKANAVAKMPMIVADTNMIFFDMMLDGHNVHTLLNTADPRSSLRLDLARDTYGVDNDSADNKPMGTLGEGTKLYAHRFKVLTADGLVIANPELVLLPSLADETINGRRALWQPRKLDIHQQPDLELGMAELRHLHVYIDYHHQTIYLTEVDATTPPS